MSSRRRTPPKLDRGDVGEVGAGDRHLRAALERARARGCTAVTVGCGCTSALKASSTLGSAASGGRALAFQQAAATQTGTPNAVADRLVTPIFARVDGVEPDRSPAWTGRSVGKVCGRRARRSSTAALVPTSGVGRCRSRGGRTRSANGPPFALTMPPADDRAVDRARSRPAPASFTASSPRSPCHGFPRASKAPVSGLPTVTGAAAARRWRGREQGGDGRAWQRTARVVRIRSPSIRQRLGRYPHPEQRTPRVH